MYIHLGKNEYMKVDIRPSETMKVFVLKKVMIDEEFRF